MEPYKNMQISNLEGEIWMPMKGAERNYCVSNLGRIKTLSDRWGKERIMKQIIGTTGYLMLNLRKGGIGKVQRSHRLIALSFLVPIQGKKFVNHKNGIKTDNRLENLEWATKSENAIHAYTLGLKKPEMKGKFGSESGFWKKISQHSKNGEKIAEFNGAREAERKTGVRYKNISQVCNGDRLSAGGFIWRFA